MHGGEHGGNVDTLKLSTVRGKQVKEISWGDVGVEGFRVLKTPDPSVFDDLEDEGPAPHLTGSNKQLGGKSGGPFSFHLFPESVGGIIFDAGVVRLDAANNGVEAYVRAERAFVGRIGEDESGRAA